MFKEIDLQVTEKNKNKKKKIKTLLHPREWFHVYKPFAIAKPLMRMCQMSNAHRCDHQRTSDLTLLNGKCRSNGLNFFFTRATRMSIACRTSCGFSLRDEARSWLRFNANDWFS